MYHFVFQNAKHRMNRYDPRRTVPHSTRGNFNLDHLRKTLGDDHTVYGFGQFPLQRVLWRDARTERVMLGHVIEVKEAKTAMWIRLNHENFCRDGVRLVEFYQDLDINWLTEQSQALGFWDRERAAFQNRISTTHSLRNNLQRFINQGSPYNSDSFADAAQEDLLKYESISEQLDDRIQRAIQSTSDILGEIKQHFDSRHTPVKTG